MNRGPLIQHAIQMVNAIVSKIFKVPNVQNVNQDTLDFLIASHVRFLEFFEINYSYVINVDFFSL